MCLLHCRSYQLQREPTFRYEDRYFYRSLCRFEVDFTVQVAGNITAKLVVNQQAVRQWSILVLPGKPYTPSTAVQVPDGPSSAGDATYLKIQLRDLYENVIPSNIGADFNGTELLGPALITAASGAMR